MVKFGKKFFFNAEYTKKSRRRLIIFGIIGIIVLIILIILLAKSCSRKKPTDDNKISNDVIIRKTIETEVYNPLPDKANYFEKLENVKLDNVTITYPNDIEFTYNVDACSEEEKLQVNGILDGTSDAKAEDYACAIKVPSKIGEYSVKVTLDKKEYNVKLNIVDKTSPTLVLKNVEIKAGDPYSINDFIESCTDNYYTSCITNYYYNAYEDNNILDYSTYTEPGSYEIVIAATDESSNTTIPQSTTLTIQPKEPNKYLVTFDSAGGSNINGEYVEEGNAVNKPNNPTRNKYDFVAWTLDGNEYDFSSPVTKDITLVAIWEAKQTQSGSGNSGSKKSCEYGSMKYSSEYTLSVYANDSKCPAAISKVDKLRDSSKIKSIESQEFEKIQNYLGEYEKYKFKYNEEPIQNKEGTGLVGYEIQVAVTEINNGDETVLAYYKLDINGKRIFIFNSINLPEK